MRGTGRGIEIRRAIPSGDFDHLQVAPGDEPLQEGSGHRHPDAVVVGQVLGGADAQRAGSHPQQVHLRFLDFWWIHLQHVPG
jgi:hypothetical protein